MSERGLLLVELQRQLDALVATDATRLTAAIAAESDIALGDHGDEQLQSSRTAERPPTAPLLVRLEQAAATFARRCFSDAVQLLLMWSDAHSQKHLAAWISAHLLATILDTLSRNSTSSRTVTSTSNSSLLSGATILSTHIIDAVMMQATMDIVLDRCFHVLHECWQTQSQSTNDTSSSGFFAFKSKQVAKPAPSQSLDLILSERVAAKWRCVLAWLSKVSAVAQIRARVQRELTQPSPSVSKLNSQTSQQQQPHHARDQACVAFLADLQLGVGSIRRASCFAHTLLNAADSSAATSVPFTQRLKDAAHMLKTLQPLLHKPTKSAVRVSAFALVARMLKRELQQMDAKTLALVFTTAHASEWNSCVSELHAVAMKNVSKRGFAAAAWDLRVAVLCIAPNDIFSRYWKDDVHALLRLQWQQNKDGTSSHSAGSTLQSIGFCLGQVVQRHFVIERKLPTEADCMEVINTTQAWCFFSVQRQRSLSKFHTRILPTLVHITLSIAAYNMTYVVQSHLRRLLTEAESVSDEKKLVGLESLLALCRHCRYYSNGDTRQASDRSRVEGGSTTLHLDANTLEANKATLGELVGHILIECNTTLGHELLMNAASTAHASSLLSGGSNEANTSAAQVLSSRFVRDDVKRAVAIQTFGAALRTLEFLYPALELSADQTMLLVAKASVHVDAHVRECAHAALHSVATSSSGAMYHAATVVRGLTDFVLRNTGNQPHGNDTEACGILVRLLGTLVCATTAAAAADGRMCWENGHAQSESLLQIEAVCVYVITYDDARLRQCALATLEAVRDTTAALNATASEAVRDESGTSEPCEPRMCVLDVVDTMERELRQRFFAFVPHDELERMLHSTRTAATAQLLPSATPPRRDDNAVALLYYLASDDTSLARHGLQWTVCLAMLCARLVQHLPAVTVYIWSDVNDKILKLEPMIASTGGASSESETRSDSVRWRNLAILATASSCLNVVAASARDRDTSAHSGTTSEHDASAHLSSASSLLGGSMQSAILSSSVMSLLKRLARFIKSPSAEQRKAAVLALGSAHASVLPILVTVLTKLEGDAFVATRSTTLSADAAQHTSSGNVGASTSTTGGSWMQARLGKGKPQTKASAVAHVQWALGRCYRMMLETLHESTHDLLVETHHPQLQPPALSIANVERMLAAARSFVDKLSVVLEQHGRSQATTECDSTHFMILQDFCVSLRSLLLRFGRDSVLTAMPATTSGAHGSADPLQRRSATAGRLNSQLFPASSREKLFYVVMAQCQSIDAFTTPTLATHLRATGFFAFASPMRHAWLQHCDVFGDCYDDTCSCTSTMTPNALVLPSSMWMDDADWSAVSMIDATAASPSNKLDTSGSGVSNNQLALCQRYFLYQTAFAALAALVQHGSDNRHNDNERIFPLPIELDAPVFQWLDDCFRIPSGLSGSTWSRASYVYDPARRRGSNAGLMNDSDTHHLAPLQTMCFDAISALLASDFATFGPICIEKALFTQPQGDKFYMAKRYFCAVSDYTHELAALCTAVVRDPIESEAHTHTASETPQLLARFFCVTMLHIGVEDDSVHRCMALCRLKRLLGCLISVPHGHALADALSAHHSDCSSEQRSLSVLRTQATSRLQVVVSSLLATSFAQLSVLVSSSLLRFISCCDTGQQRKLFAVALPWLAATSLVVPLKELDRALHARDDDPRHLMSLLFRLTRNLSASCSDQLEHAWLTLAFTTQPPDDIVAGFNEQEEEDDEDDLAPSTNLGAILQFLFRQRATVAHVATAKTVVWWLSRWQHAAFDVVATLLDHVAIRRRQGTRVDTPSIAPALDNALSPSSSSATTRRRDSFTDDAAAQQRRLLPLHDVAMLLALLADSSTHLLTIASQDATCALDDVALQIVHTALLSLYRSLVDERAFGCEDTHGSDAPDSNDDDTAVWCDDGVVQDSLLTLRNVLPLLDSPMSDIDALLDELSLLLGNAASMKTDHAHDDRNTSNATRRERFETAIAAFARSGLPLAAIVLWRNECVKEFALAIALFSVDKRSTAFDTTAAAINHTTAQTALCLQFALRTHQLVAAPFDGDVFLTLMELLHRTLDEQYRDPSNANALVCECLSTLRAMVARMPASTLVLYPQILWVSMALLSPTATSSAYRSAVVDLLFEVVHTPHFFTSAVAHDVLLSKRPSQWSPTQSSVLRAIALHAFGVGASVTASSQSSDCNSDERHRQRRARAQRLLGYALVHPSAILGASAHEHVAICSLVLVLRLLTDSDTDDAWNSDLEAPHPTDRVQRIATDLCALWRVVASSNAQKQLCDLFERVAERESSGQQLPPQRPESSSADDTLLTSFVSNFVSFVHLSSSSSSASSTSLDIWSVCFEILVNAVASARQQRQQQKQPDRTSFARQRTMHERPQLALTALWLIEALLCEIERCSDVVWQMPPALAASLAMLLQEPIGDDDDDAQWTVSVRIMCYAAANARVVPASVQPLARTSNALSRTPEKAVLALAVTPTTDAAENNFAAAPSSPPPPPSTPSKKDSTARKFISFVTGRRPSSPNVKAMVSSNNGSNNNGSEHTSSCSGSSSSNVVSGSHAAAAAAAGATDNAQDPARGTVASLQKGNGAANEPGDDDSMPPPPSRTRSMFR